MARRERGDRRSTGPAANGATLGFEDARPALDKQRLGELIDLVGTIGLGATMPNLNTGILSAVPLILPPDDVLDAFARIVDPLQALMVAKNAEVAALSALRDALLPRLLSGELPIPDAERFVGNAT